MRQTLKKGYPIVTKKIWTGDYEENARRLLATLGFVAHEDTNVGYVILQTPAGTAVYSPHPNTYIEMCYMEYCHYLIPAPYLMDKRRLLQDIKRDAALFFAERWTESSKGFVSDLIRATDITIKVKS